MTQLFVFCWFGNEVTVRILKVSYTAFNVLRDSTNLVLTDHSIHKNVRTTTSIRPDQTFFA
ncbi:hypothetical protein TSAR_005297 [Trichomalopsis sarcophagae]|uniref:Uncharacterized protein n=1 Tax=Trichomalopsis sarcophagae TaxID=543379 RepID=A0A232ESP3_9HYME|nr:hypothetical protein TSAR_005297 [Trichomalopsis sarcophagae]